MWTRFVTLASRLVLIPVATLALASALVGAGAGQARSRTAAKTVAPPTSLAVTSTTASSVSVAWAASKSPFVSSYAIYVDGAEVGRTPETNFVISPLPCGTQTTVAVDAVDDAGNHSTQATVTAETDDCPDTAAPSKPTSLLVEQTSPATVSLSWSPATDNVGVTGYRVFLDGSAVAMTSGTTYTFTGLTCGTIYQLGVTAEDGAGNTSTQSTTATTTDPCVTAASASDVQAPTVPPNEKLTVIGPTTLTLAWSASTDNVGVTGYRLFLNGAAVGTTTSLNYTFSGLSCNTTYTVSITAYDAAGNQSNPAYGTGHPTTSACSSDAQVPTVPPNEKFTVIGPTTLTLAWSASTDNVGVTGYRLFLNGAAVGTTTSLNYTFSGLSCNTTYTVSITAYDAAGNQSDPAYGTGHPTTAGCSDTQAPSAPNGITVANVTSTGATLSWAAASDNVGVAGYTVYWDGTTRGTTSSTTYDATTLTCGTTHTFGVDAYDAAGNHSGMSSVTIATAVCSDSQAPSTPAGLQVISTSQGSVSVSWSASTDNLGVVGYTVYRGSTALGNTTSTTYTASGLACGTTYIIAVEAFDGSGNRSSKASVSTTTAGCADGQAPSAPSGLSGTGSSQSSVSVSWAASSDNVGVAGYGLYRNGSSVGTSSSTSATFSGLSCGTSYTVAVDAFDAAGNRSGQTSLVVTTAACGGGAAANLWVDPSGGSCARQVIAGAWNDAQGCASIQAAAAACVPGDTIGMKAGNYGAQTITTNLAAPGCTVVAESGVTAGKLATNGNWLTIQGGSFAGWEPSGSAGQPHDIHLVGTTITSQVWFSSCCSNITMTGGSISGVNDGGSPAAVMVQGLTSSTPISNITFDGVEFKNANCTTAGNHYEVVRTQGWATNLTIKNSYFHNNGVNSSQIFISSFTGGTDHTPGPITIQNNFFAPPVAPSCGPGPAYFQINGNMQGQPCPDLTVAYNTSLSSLTTVWDSSGANCSTGQNTIRFKANIAPKSAGNCGANSWDHNLWINGSNANCGTGDQTVANTTAAGLIGDGFHISTTSPARAAGDPTNCPATDHDGNPRANPTGTTCDTGQSKGPRPAVDGAAVRPPL